ncbi:unnamed protein product [Hyaloperonospora brassicae]|uniref:adenine phosphoribosyltransferase n=1 Tax=Hyaloperonospora brassicae TaxID=162125 RepID=A0AAV0UYI6_HYABA|nr:unnamed protein product [Hyaloperonospora brassicae]
MSLTKLNLDDPEVRHHARVGLATTIPVVPFKGVAFFDIGGLLANPEKLQLALHLLVHAVTPLIDNVDAIGCVDARGFLFAPYLGVHFHKRVFMLRKPDKMPSVGDTVEYVKEYKGDHSGGGDHLSIQTYAVQKGDRVLLVDDLLATGGTCEAAIRLVQQAGASVTACTFVVEISGLNGRGRARQTSTNEQMAILSLLTEKDF